MKGGLKRVLITGAAGRLGRVLRAGLAGDYLLRLNDVVDMGEAGEGEEIRQGSIADPAFAQDLCRDCDAVVHLAAEIYDKDWPAVLDANFRGTINIYEGARSAGTERVVFGSSNHVTGLYKVDDPIGPDAAHRPDSRYGVSKAFGESLGAMFAYKYGIRSFCMRIGNCKPTPPDRRALSTWLSYGDFERLVRVGLTADYLFEVVYGVSKVREPWWDIANARRLGYEPQDDAEAFRAQVEHIVPADPVEQALQGGIYAATEFEFSLPEIPPSRE